MPVLARFYGIVIKMYFLGAEHNPRTFTQYTETMPQPSISEPVRC